MNRGRGRFDRTLDRVERAAVEPLLRIPKVRKVRARRPGPGVRGPAPNSVGKIVRTLLARYHRRGRIHELRYEVVRVAVLRFKPDSLFSRQHLSWYKHHFLRTTEGDDGDRDR